MCKSSCATQKKLSELLSDFDTVCEANRSLAESLKKSKSTVNNLSLELSETRKDRDRLLRIAEERKSQIDDLICELRETMEGR